MADRPAPSDPARESMLLECVTPWCSDKGRQWRVWHIKVQPGLLEIRNVICAACGCAPVPAED